MVVGWTKASERMGGCPGADVKAYAEKGKSSRERGKEGCGNEECGIVG